MQFEGLVCAVAALAVATSGAVAQQQSKNWYPWINPNTKGVTATIVSLDLDKNAISNTLAPIKYNAFCAGHSQAADGGVHVIGGDMSASSTLIDASKNYPLQNSTDAGTFLYAGIDRMRHYDPVSGQWDESNTMTTGRWYPTVVTLGDGSLFITSGSTKNLDFGNLAGTINPTYEFYPKKYQDAIHSQILEWSFPHNLYPTAFQLPGGKIFMMVSNRTVLIDPSIDPGQNEANTVEIAPVPAMDHQPWVYPHTPTGFLLPMKESENWAATVVICGGTLNSTKDASADCISLQPEVSGAQWKMLPKMPNARLMPDSVLLPDGTVLVTNGVGWGQAGGNAGDCQYASAPVFATDLYNPSTNTWTTVGNSAIARMYHSGAILMEDASVITTGSEMANYLDFWGTQTAKGVGIEMVNITRGVKQQCWPSMSDDLPLGDGCADPYQYSIEHFSPSYLSNNLPRPIIAPTTDLKWTYGSTVGLTVSGTPAASISLIRYTTTTHSTNTDQRLLIPTVLFANATYVVFKVPPNGNVAPPGNWHVFAMSKDGVPSVAQRVLMGPGDVTAVTVPSGGVTVPTQGGAAGTTSKSDAMHVAVAAGAAGLVGTYLLSCARPKTTRPLQSAAAPSSATTKQQLASNDCLDTQLEVPVGRRKFAASMPHGQLMLDAPILPNGTVSLTNGDGWGQAGGMGKLLRHSKNYGARMYHFGARLLQDAMVITTGSEMARYLGATDVIGPLSEIADYCFPC
ncbi:hypothetical protein BC830DRAFT_1169966 [Chytriomyces sp. MP71]|nr:hypothetical protein BC830DRAFT_1169966 [Chytriomyces sp. MP71]